MKEMSCLITIYYPIIRNMMNLIAYADGEKDLLEIAEIVKVPAWSLFDMVRTLKDNNILE